MPNNDFLRKIEEIRREVPKAMKRLPGIAKVEGLKFIGANFKNQGFEDKKGNIKKWEKKKKGNKPTLIGEKRGGQLRRAWTGEEGDNQVAFVNPMIYAEVHNEGLRAGRPPGFDMPQRQMIGPSETLNQAIEKKFDEVAKKIFE